jgi:hypothetical protein
MWQGVCRDEEEDEEEEDLFVFNDSIEGPRAPAVKPGRAAQPSSQAPAAAEAE